MNEINIQNVLDIYEKEISKNVKNKKRIYNFEINKMQNIANICYLLRNAIVGHKNYNIFLIFEPKCRLVMSLTIQDKIINHYITRYILEPKLTKYLDIRNCATRKGMGTDYAIKLLKKYLEENKRKYNNFYVLKIDISKFFYSIDHNVLKKMLQNKLDSFEFKLISKVIDSTNEKYINDAIDSLTSQFKCDIPNYLYDKGLPIGNMTSQFLSIFYLYDLDHFIVHNLGLKYYVRYMDDFVIISHDLNKLKEARDIIVNKLEKEYLLNCNYKKTIITKVKDGFSFLGYSFKVINHKTIIKIKQSNYQKVKNKVKKTRYLLDNKYISYDKAFCTITTYANAYKYADNNKMLRIIDKYFYEN